MAAAVQFAFLFLFSIRITDVNVSRKYGQRYTMPYAPDSHIQRYTAADAAAVAFKSKCHSNANLWVARVHIVDDAETEKHR